MISYLSGDNMDVKLKFLNKGHHNCFNFIQITNYKNRVGTIFLGVSRWKSKKVTIWIFHLFGKRFQIGKL